MHPDVMQVLRAAGARFGPDRGLRFREEAEEACLPSERVVVAPLVDDAVLRITGGDAQAFLQGQLPTDVPPTGSDRHLLAACCTPKGRVVATFRLAARTSGYAARLPLATAPGLLARLGRYRLRAHVEFHEGRLVALGVAGPGAAEAIDALTHEAPPPPGGVLETGGLAVVRSAREPNRYEVYTPLARFPETFETLAREGVPVGPAAFRLVELRAHLPWLFPETAEGFVPQMLGLVELGAVSFTKGCYPGQEVVARTQHLGKVKRGLVRARVMTDAVPEPGAAIDSRLADRTTPAGRVLYAARAERGTELLAVLAHGALAGTELRIAGEAGSPVELIGRLEARTPEP